MYTIVGLGNPGSEYEKTRHNVGWLVLEWILHEHTFSACVSSAQYGARFSEGVLHGIAVGIVFPTAYMNNSGVSLAKYLKKNGSLETLVVVHDDIDLPFGDVRISHDRGAGGHNGIVSIIKECGSKDFTRIRIGIAQKGFLGGVKRPQGDALSAYVLGEFKVAELKMIPDISKRVDAALKLILEKGVLNAMQEMNIKT
jgi:PTH1 family peptidyl-tRNA hydrolase